MESLNTNSSTKRKGKVGRKRLPPDKKKLPISFTCPPEYYPLLKTNPSRQMALILRAFFSNPALCGEFIKGKQLDKKEKNRDENNS